MTRKIKEVFIVLSGYDINTVAIVQPTDNEALWKARSYAAQSMTRLRALGLVGGDLLFIRPKRRLVSGHYLGAYLQP